MSKPTSGFLFSLMAFEFKIRDFFRPRKYILQEVGIKPGFKVLDFGCGPGGYIIATARLIGKSGVIYAVDINSVAIKMVKNIANKEHLENVTTIVSDCKTGLPDNSVDVVLLYDILHDLGDPECVLEELQRVLKPDGVLSVSDHHLKGNEIESKVTNKGLFIPAKKGAKTYSFSVEQTKTLQL